MQFVQIVASESEDAPDVLAMLEGAVVHVFFQENWQALLHSREINTNAKTAVASNSPDRARADSGVK